SRPMTGTVMWRRSDSSRIGSVVNRTRPRSRWRALNRGNPTGEPARRPCLDADHAWRAPTTSAIPLGEVSLEQHAHQGGTWALAWFQVRRRLGSVQASGGIDGSAARASKFAFTWASAQL